MSAAFELVVFDWDGTLIDSTHAITDSLRASAADLGLPVPSRERASHVIGLGLLDAIHYAVPAIRSEQVPLFVDRYRSHFLARDAQLHAFDGIERLLAESDATGVMLAVATGKPRAGLDRALLQTGWKPRFAATRTADEGIPKPDPWMLEDILDELGVAAQRTVMIGDTTHDLRMAQAAGTASVAVTYGAHPVAELLGCAPTACVDSVEALRAWLMPQLLAPGAGAGGGAR